MATTLTGTVRSCGMMNRGLLGTRPSTCVTGSVRVTETASTHMPSPKPASAPRRGLSERRPGPPLCVGRT